MRFERVMLSMSQEALAEHVIIAFPLALNQTKRVLVVDLPCVSTLGGGEGSYTSYCNPITLGYAGFQKCLYRRRRVNSYFFPI